MNKAILAVAVVSAGALGAGAAQAQETGRVISSTPVIQQVAVPRQVCTQEQVSTSAGGTSGGGAVVGAIVGGLLGNTVGGGSGRLLATGVGAVAGAAVGDHVEAGQQAPRTVQNCSTQTTYENRTVGYNVQYEFNGKQYNVQLPYDPGPTIKLQVSPVSAAPADNVTATAAAPAPATTQPVAVILADNSPTYAQPVYVYPAYAPYYYRPWYPPVSLSLGFGWYGGHRHWH